MQNQLIYASASRLAPRDVDIPSQLDGITSEQPCFLRVHDIQPANVQ